MTLAGSSSNHRRGPSFFVAALSATAAAAIVLADLVPIVRAWPAGPVAGGLAVLLVAGVATTWLRPRRRLPIALPAAALVVLWCTTRLLGLVPGADPWLPVDATVGLTSAACATLAVVALVAAVTGGRPPQRRAMYAPAVPVLLVVLLLGVVGTVTATNGFTGTPVPAAVVAPAGLPAGARSTVEYCRPGGARLPMDVYTPPAPAPAAAPVVVYVHGGGFVLGNRTSSGPFASAQDDALWAPVRDRLRARGLVVASIDYRLLPAAGWRAPVEDVKCAIRFLRAHAAELRIDPGRIGVWGGSAGGTLAALAGLTGGRAGFDTGQYTGQYAGRSSSVQAVVDMFGASDLTDLSGSSGFLRAVAWSGLGGSQSVRRALSPLEYAGPGAPPFLILHGLQDTGMPVRQSRELADKLRAAGSPVTFVTVAGTGHGLATPGEQPSAAELTRTVTDFLTTALTRTPVTTPASAP